MRIQLSSILMHTAALPTRHISMHRLAQIITLRQVLQWLRCPTAVV